MREHTDHQHNVFIGDSVKWFVIDFINNTNNTMRCMLSSNTRSLYYENSGHCLPWKLSAMQFMCHTIDQFLFFERWQNILSNWLWEVSPYEETKNKLRRRKCLFNYFRSFVHLIDWLNYHQMWETMFCLFFLNLLLIICRLKFVFPCIWSYLICLPAYLSHFICVIVGIQ